MPVIGPEPEFTLLTVDDLPSTMTSASGLTVEQMVTDAVALAMLAAPCLATTPTELTEDQQAAVKAILRGAVLRWSEAGSGALTQQQVGPFGATIDNRQARKGMFWPSEITQLQDICKGDSTSGAFSVDTIGTNLAIHAEVCALRFGATYCSCGADLTMSFPLYELP